MEQGQDYRAIESKVRACDLVRVRVRDITQGIQVAARLVVVQRNTRRPGLADYERSIWAAFDLKAEVGCKIPEILLSTRNGNSATHDLD